MRRAVPFAILLAACASDRPVHPMRLEGFPGAPIEPGLFPLANGTRWTFSDAEGKTLTLAVNERDGAFVLTGQTEGEAEIRIRDGFLEILYQGQVLDRPLKMEGAAGDRWEAAGATYTVFGYDEIEVLGRKTRALVVAADRKVQRDLYWFAKDLGWVRLRTERTGATLRDARLVAFEGGGRPPG
ncbi:MAG TPA: hypothetical protein VFY93_19885 [Planctomycetota bacterium]|nr:hypothetical protein [Planctomycetota bacterium]